MPTFVDKIYWGFDDGGNLVARPQPLDFNYPAEADVQDGKVYGYEDQYEGIATIGSTPTTPSITSISDARDGSTATATIVSDDDVTNYVYAWRRTGSILEKSILGSRTGSGNVTLTGSTTGNYIAVVVSSDPSTSSLSLFSDPRPFSITGDYNYQIRDNAARAAVHILSHSELGDQVIFKNGDNASEINIWCKIDSGDQTITLRGQSLTGEQNLILTVPRQSGFPPGDTSDSWNHTALIKYNNEIYEIDRIIPSSGIPRTSAEFTVECSRSKSGTY